MAVKYGTAQTAYDEGRREGMRVGLEMADKFVALTKDKKDAAAMIRAALMTLKDGTLVPELK
jgi:hypothetical protein